MNPAARVAGQGLSPIRRMSVGAPAGTVDLGLGEPGWALPAPARRALAGLGTDDRSQEPLPYGPNTSDPGLVEAIGTFTGRTAPAEVMVTSGSQAALFALFSAYVDPGTVVLVPDPGFVAYPTLARLCGARPVGYPLDEDGDLDADALVRVLGEHPHTSMVVLNHPSNPTGGLAGPAALERVAQACVRRDVLLVSDEVYAELWLQDAPASLHDAAGPEAGVVLGSVSKAFAAPGLRVGWAVGTEQVLAPARLVHNAMTTAPARPSQVAAHALLEAAGEVLPAAREQLRRRAGTVGQLAPGLPGRPVRAGLYLWLPVPAGVDPGETEAFALRLRDEGGVTTIPGTAFGARGAGFLRVSLGGPTDDLEEGLRRLAPWWKA
ncbi:pyridoxal phosphate-dependent aminotransferase [Ornithinimicrobium sp. LYQ92]|uniref:pyridoxal phosphate-dependent aminotransferase n=1 Tax=Serinicoccus sp. LYQ92 TaxID=3378798 RepID=UPI003854CB5A